MMRRIVVANPKGGCGKSTLAIHIATWFARCDEVVCICDLDRQQSSRRWLDSRNAYLPSIRVWDAVDGAPESPPKSCNIGILDTPAGLQGKQLRKLIADGDRIVVPVLPSRFDMQASLDFFAELSAIKAVRKERISVAIVAMRVDSRTNTTQQLLEFLRDFDVPLVACIRNAQLYVRALEIGVTLFDCPNLPSPDIEHWQPLLHWLSKSRP